VTTQLLLINIIIIILLDLKRPRILAVIKVGKNQPKFPFQTEEPYKILTRESMKALRISKESNNYLSLM